MTATTAEYLAAVFRQDTSAAVDLVLREAATGVELATLVEQVLAPAQVEVGLRWQRRECTVADEHAATAVTEVVLGALSARTRPTPARTGTVCVAVPSGEWHAMPARMFAEMLRSWRWEVIYLGADVPPADLGRFLARVQPAALLLGCTMVTALPSLARAAEVAQEAGVPTIVGGCGTGPDERRARLLGANAWAGTAHAAHELLVRWCEEGVRAPKASRVRLPADYLELVGQRSTLLGELSSWAEPALRVLSAGGGRRSVAEQVTAGLLDVLAASLLVDDPQAFREHASWLLVTLQARSVPPAVTVEIIGRLRTAVAELPRAVRFAEVG